MAETQRVCAILAGGTGSRVGAEQPKQFIEIAGATVIEHTVQALLDWGRLDQLLVVMPEAHLDRAREVLDRDERRRDIPVIAGGETRCASSALAVLWFAERYELEARVFLHDAARPMVGAALLDRIDAALDRRRAVAAALPSTDTIVRVDHGLLQQVEPRDELWRVQTPQAFALEVIGRAHRKARAGCTATDDAGLVRAMLPHEPIAVVPGEPDNLKITTPADLEVAERLLSRSARQ